GPPGSTVRGSAKMITGGAQPGNGAPEDCARAAPAESAKATTQRRSTDLIGEPRCLCARSAFIAHRRVEDGRESRRRSRASAKRWRGGERRPGGSPRAGSKLSAPSLLRPYRKGTEKVNQLAC